MHTKSLIALLFAACSVSAQSTTDVASPTATANASAPNPTESTSAPQTAVAIIHNNTVHFNVTFVQANGGSAIWVANHLPADQGPYQYHIHNLLVSNGNCSTTGPHLNPYNATISLSTPGNITSYEIGDLAGKWGNVTAHAPSGMSMDVHGLTNSTLATSVDPTFNVSNIIGHSIVVHNSTGARIGCANIYPANATGGPDEQIPAGYPVAFPAVQASVSAPDVGKVNATAGGNATGGHAGHDSGAVVNVASKMVYGLVGALGLVAASL
ncbi:hypothetical protein HDV00_002935 [Rhizophlyctis rosea]|nr:hypothetical protein HDV00_002935 [Rhizophlyctis rosea]